jgi:hypothetical protein
VPNLHRGYAARGLIVIHEFGCLPHVQFSFSFLARRKHAYELLHSTWSSNRWLVSQESLPHPPPPPPFANKCALVIIILCLMVPCVELTPLLFSTTVLVLWGQACPHSATENSSEQTTESG